MRWDPSRTDPRCETVEQLAIHLLKNSVGEWNSLTPERMRVMAERLMVLNEQPHNRLGQVVDARHRFTQNRGG